MPAPELIIFDCDGVLVDSEIIACRTDAEYLTEIGFPISTEEILARYVGISTSMMTADLELRFGRKLPADFLEKLRKRVTQAFVNELRAVEGVAALLDMLPGKKCVASSSFPDRIDHTLTLTGLRGHFGPHVFSA